MAYETLDTLESLAATSVNVDAPRIIDLGGKKVTLRGTLKITQAVVLCNGTLEWDDGPDDNGLPPDPGPGTPAIRITSGGVTLEDIWLTTTTIPTNKTHVAAKDQTEALASLRKSTGIELSGVSSLTFSRVRVVGFDVGVELRACSSIRFFACNFSQNNTHIVIDSLIHRATNPTKITSDGNEDLHFLGCTFGQADGLAQVHFRGKSTKLRDHPQGHHFKEWYRKRPDAWRLEPALEAYLKSITIDHFLNDCDTDSKLKTLEKTVEDIQARLTFPNYLRSNFAKKDFGIFSGINVSNTLSSVLECFRAQFVADLEFRDATAAATKKFETEMKPAPTPTEYTEGVSAYALSEPATTTSFIHCRFSGPRNSTFSVLANSATDTSFISCRWESSPPHPGFDGRRLVGIALYLANRNRFISCMFIGAGIPLFDIGEETEGVQFLNCEFPSLAGNVPISDCYLKMASYPNGPDTPVITHPPQLPEMDIGGGGRNVRIRNGSVGKWKATRFFGNSNMPDVASPDFGGWYP